MPSLIKPAFPYFSWPAFAGSLRACEGWRRVWAAFAFGALTSLAFAPIGFFPVLWLSFPALFFLLQGTRTAAQVFITGWSFAFGGFVFGWYWIAASMFVDIGHFWWAVPLAVAGLPAFFALYYSAALTLVWKIGRKLPPLSGVVVTALAWFLADYARGHLFGGFPWNLEGYVWTKVLPVLQITSITGIYGLTLLTLLCALLPACLAEHAKRHRAPVLGSLVFLALIGAWGELRLVNAPVAWVPDVRLRLGQPNVDQAHKWLMDEREGNFRQLLDLSSTPVASGEKPVTHIVWPETAATYYLVEDAVRRRVIAAHIPPHGAVLTGVIRRSPDADGHLRYYNSLIALDDHARVVAGYDKVHLVPFGEFIPMRRFLPLRPLINLGLDFTAGDGPHSLRVAGLPPFSPLVCYEVIFSGDVADPDDRPQFLLNVTNDGWYGRTAGPYQHFATARVRAIEEGVPLVRAANTGISGVVDAYGRMVVRLGVGKVGFVDSDLPQAAAPTFFNHYGEKPLWLVFTFMVSGLISRWILARRG